MSDAISTARQCLRGSSSDRLRRAIVAAKVGAVAAGAISVAFLHHGHIIAFLARVTELFPKRLPKRLRAHEVRSRPSLIQVYFADPAAHYEVHVQRKTRSIEIGLHFEGDREANRRWGEALASCASEIRAQLGPAAELEEWTARWTRLHETRQVAGKEWSPKASLTEELALDVSERLARYIEVLEPIVRRERASVGG